MGRPSQGVEPVDIVVGILERRKFHFFSFLINFLPETPVCVVHRRHRSLTGPMRLRVGFEGNWMTDER